MRTHPASSHPDLLVGTETSDDAGVYRLSSESALVQTVDFFTPVVDNPYDWGRIAAANALSDVYAMGATPVTALQMVGWPRDRLGFDVLADVVRGGADVMHLAGCTIVGGHSVDDVEPKYGFAVTGFVDPSRVVTNAGARAGDLLVLTKPIGTGIIATAIKRDGCPEPVARRAIDVMAMLNRDASIAMSAVGVGAATDVTGFGFLGHLGEMLVASGVSAVVGDVAVIEGAWELLDAGFFPGGSERNVEAARPMVAGDYDERRLRMLCDAQTSGGLLMSASPRATAALIDGIDGAVVVGAVEAGPAGRVRLD